MQTLDGLEHEFDSEMLLICDASVSHDIGGIMGGLHSSVTKETADILLECALFEPKSIRRTRKALGISTDASYRFERGVDPEGHLPAVKRALEVILSTAGGEVDGPIMEVLPRPWEPFSLTLRLSRVSHVLGVSLGAEEIGALLKPLGFDVDPGGEDELNVTVPGYRSYDVTREVDLIEEIARTHGYDNFPDDLGPARPTTVPDHPLFQLEDNLRLALAGTGLLEATNPAFAPESEGDVELNNPISTEESHLRGALLPALLRRVEYNFARGARDVRLFEIGTVFHSCGLGDPPREDLHVALTVTGRRRPAHWSEEVEAVDFWTLKGLVQETLAESGWEGASVGPRDESPETGDGGRGGEVAADGLFVPSTVVGIRLSSSRSIGSAGQIRPDRIDAPAWAGPVWAMELRLPAEPRLERTPTFRPLPQFPGVDRDLALLVRQNVSADSVVECIRGSGGALLDEVTIFDMYRSEGVGESERSLAFRLRLQAWDRTLTDEEVDRVVGKVIKRLAEDLGVEQRL
jgi:phenylalanyl-tRNA synthetase beta chain